MPGGQSGCLDPFIHLSIPTSDPAGTALPSCGSPVTCWGLLWVTLQALPGAWPLIPGSVEVLGLLHEVTRQNSAEQSLERCPKFSISHVTSSEAGGEVRGDPGTTVDEHSELAALNIRVLSWRDCPGL